MRNRLHSAGLRARRPYVGVPLSQRHRQARQAWTRQLRQWTNQQWATVLFTDESRFLLDMLDRRRRVWRRRGERFVPVQSCLCLTELWQANATSGCSAFCSTTPRSTAGWQRKTPSGEDSTAVPAAEQCWLSRLACSIPWLVANRVCLGHSRPACTTESNTTKNAPSFGRSLAGGVEEDTSATDCQTHQEYASSLCGLHRCNDIDRFVRFYWWP